MKKILLPEQIIQPGIDLLEEHSDIEIVKAKDTSEEAIIEAGKDVFGIVLRSKAKITRKIIESIPSLKIISRTGAGFDNVDVSAATDNNVMVCNLPGVNNVSVAEHTIGFLFALMKQFPKMDSYVRTGNWKKRSNFISVEMYGKTLGIIGLGKIGYHVMTLAKGIGMNVLAYDPYVKDKYKDKVDFCDNIEEIFEKSDAVTVHVPNLPETRGTVTESLLRKMKETAYFINTSRGGIVDEKGLIKVLQEDKIAGAGIDVFENEPINEDNPLIKMDNVILSPHTSGLTKESGLRMTVNAVKQVIDAVEGKVPPYIVNRAELNL